MRFFVQSTERLKTKMKIVCVFFWRSDCHRYS